MKKHLVKIGLVLILTVILVAGCNKATPKISEDYAIRSTELAAYSLVPSEGEFSAFTPEQIEKEGTPVEMESLNKIGDNQWIEGFFAPVSPTDKDTVFFSTQMQDATSSGLYDKMLNRILSYNIKTGEAKELYKEEENRVLRTIGIDGNKVIVMYDLIDNSPGPCFSVWADWKDFGYLDITKPEAGLSAYNMPDYKITEGQEAQKKCEQDNGL
ncbi:MAG: hypothetical protein AAB953_00390 [Patescibacteria group bacterium]